MNHRMAVPGQVLYIGENGLPTGSSNLSFEDVNTYNGSRLGTNNLQIKYTTSLGGNVGVGTGTARDILEVTGYSIFTAQGTNSRAENEFGLNGDFDTLSLLSPLGLGVNATTSIFFGLNSQIYYPMARIVVRDDTGSYTASMAFQTGEGSHLVERMRIDTTGYIGIGHPAPQYTLDVSGMTHISNNVFLNGETILYRKYTIPIPNSGSVYLNFPNVGSTSTTIDIEFSLSGSINSTIAKFTVFLSEYQGNKTGLYVNNISVQTNGLAFFGPYNINANTYDPLGLSIQVNYINAPITAAVNYTAYGPGAYKITEINITPIALVAAPPP